jgi:NAD+ synthase (glutamine-hydrolysing)
VVGLIRRLASYYWQKWYKRAHKQLGNSEFELKSGIDLGAANIPAEIINKLITTAYQGTDHSSTETLQSAEALAKSVGAVFYNWSIQPSFENARKTIEKTIGRELNWQKDDITLQNIQARSRSPLIWMLANITNSLLITTSNRSEGAVGYATMDGDTSGSLSPIAGIDKPFILQWLKWAQEELDYPALEYVNNLTPSAELRPLTENQSDEEDLMPYAILNRIEELFAVERRSPLAIYEELKKEVDNEHLEDYIIRFFSLWSRNQWKRERLAPSFHIDDRNLDPRSWFRFPILSGSFKAELKALKAKK